MPSAAYCSECRRYVWVIDSGCANGHPRSCLRDVCEREFLPAPPAANPAHTSAAFGAPSPPVPPAYAVAPSESAAQAGPCDDVPSQAVPYQAAPSEAPAAIPSVAPAYGAAAIIAAAPAYGAAAVAGAGPVYGAAPYSAAPGYRGPSAGYAAAAPGYSPADIYGGAPLPVFGASIASQLDTHVMALRIAALFVDTAIITTVFALMLLLTPRAVMDVVGHTPTYVPYIFLGLCYYIPLEASKIQGTVGKVLFGLRVVSDDGGQPDIMQIVWRNLARIVDWILFGIVGLVVCEQSPTRQRVGDKLAHTYVVRVR